jgi:hypothetical protein
LLEPNGDVKLQYLRMTSSALNSATIGIENAAGTVALQVVNSANYVHNNLAVRFHLPDAPWLSESPRYGVLAPDSSVNITVTFDAGSLQPNSINRADIHLIATHPDVSGDIIVPAILNVRPTTGIEETSPAIPTQFSLEQNYPNPFNPVTNFQFTVPHSSFTILMVYDLLGREIATLVNEVKQPGTYTVQFDGSGLASGIYFYRLDAGRFNKIQKMILMK